MAIARFDRIRRALAEQGLTRRRTLATGLARPATQDGTPEPDLPPPDAEHGPTMLFVQTFQSGTITPKEGADGRYTLTLEAGTGQTVYFSDRPDRVVGASPTPHLLAGLGFPDDDPPNAALVVETAPGETDVAVVELFNPLYDPIGHGVTYEVEVLGNWQNELELGFHEAPTDLAALAPSFGAAHLYIDDCPDSPIHCYEGSGGWVGAIPNSDHDGFCYSVNYAMCLPCQPWFYDGPSAFKYWSNECNARYPACNNTCKPKPVCTWSLFCQCPQPGGSCA